MQLWQRQPSGLRKRTSANPGGFNTGYVAISPDHQLIAVQVENFVTSLSRWEGTELIETARLTSGVPIAITDDNRRLIVSIPVAQDQIFDLTTNPPRRMMLPDGYEPLRGMTLSADGRSVFAVRANGEVIELDPTGDDVRFVRSLGQLDTPKPPAPAARLAPSPDGRRLFVSDHTGRSWWLDLSADAPAKRLTPAWTFPGAILRAEFARDGRHILLVNSNGTAYVLRL